MLQKKHKTEEIVAELWQVDVLVSNASGNFIDQCSRTNGAHGLIPPVAVAASITSGRRSEVSLGKRTLCLSRARSASLDAAKGAAWAGRR